MKLTLRLVLAIVAWSPVSAFAADPKAPELSPAEAEAKYTADITARADKIVAKLGIDDTAKATRVRDRIAAQYRTLRTWHDEHDATVKALEQKKSNEATIEADSIRQTLKPLHDQFLSDLAADLSPEQIDIVKDGMTFNVLNVTYKAYTEMILTLTDEQKAYIRQQLTEAREIAMDQGSSEEKHAVFGKYKGRINIYLSKAGYNMKAEEKAWQARLREERAARGATTQPSN